MACPNLRLLVTMATEGPVMASLMGMSEKHCFSADKQCLSRDVNGGGTYYLDNG